MSPLGQPDRVAIFETPGNPDRVLLVDLGQPDTAAPTAGAQPAGDNTVDPREIAIWLCSRLRLPDAQIRASPSTGVVAVPTWFWVEGYGGEDLTDGVSIDVPAEVGADVPTEVPADDARRQGTSVGVQVRVHPSRYTWSFGDGASAETRSLGRAYPQESDVQHVYEASSPGSDAFTVTLTIEFAVEFRANGSDFEPLPPLQRRYEARQTVQQVQTVAGRKQP